MAMTWNFKRDKSVDNDRPDFTKFPVGVTTIRVVDDTPYVRWTHWQPKHNRSICCPGRGCPICEIRKRQKANKQPITQNKSMRASIHIINRETGKLEICESGIQWFSDLHDLMQELASKGKSLQDVDITVKRRGTSKDDTSYRLDIGNEYPLSDADKKLLEDRLDLEEFFTPHTSEQIQRIVSGEDWLTVMRDAEPHKTEEPWAFSLH